MDSLESLRIDINDILCHHPSTYDNWHQSDCFASELIKKQRGSLQMFTNKLSHCDLTWVSICTISPKIMIFCVLGLVKRFFYSSPITSVDTYWDNGWSIPSTSISIMVIHFQWTLPRFQNLRLDGYLAWFQQIHV